MTVEMGSIEYRETGSHVICVCGEEPYWVTDAHGHVMRANWSGCTFGCGNCGRVLSIEGVVLLRTEVQA